VSRRDFIIGELGLSPLWVRREAHEAKVDVPTDQSGGTESRRTEAVSDRLAKIQAMDWAALKSSASACTACALHKARKQAVVGVGDEKAEWLFVGEAPGADEDERGEPFVGQAGKLLDNMLASIALQRGKNVYIANIVKCRPPGNRTPEPVEAQACDAYLRRQFELIRPRLIIALGRVAAQNLLGIEATLASLRGRVHDYHGTPLIVTYHPAYLLRNLVDKAKSWEDLCFARETMAGLRQQHPAMT
jgi:uracil-DNA glycosylase family 4